MRRDADLAVVAAAARRGRRGARNSKTRVGGRWRGRLECAEFSPCQFRAGRLFGRTGQQSGGALLEGDDLWRLDRAAEGNPRSSSSGGRHDGGDGARDSA